MQVNQIHTLSNGIFKIPCIEELLGVPLRKYNFRSKDVNTIACWGYKKTSLKAERIAKRANCNLIRLEDGFITHSTSSDKKLSICIDRNGMHYATNSDLHSLCLRNFTQRELERARAAIEFKNDNYISKYNHIPILSSNEMHSLENRILIIDQVSDDESIKHSGADLNTFINMIKRATKDNPGSKILIKTHPDNKNKKSFCALLSQSQKQEISNLGDIHFISTPINSMQLVKQVTEVHTISSLLGFEAALLGKKVIVHGNPFYAGYGFTVDITAPFRDNIPIEAVFHAAYIDYCSYINPITGKVCHLEDVLEIIKANMTYYPLTQLVIQKPSLWKRNFLKKFLRYHSLLPPVFNRSFYNAEWGYNPCNESEIHVEDAFIRSCGLGSSLTLPNSLAIDRNGIYYDFKSNSSLQRILEQHTFTVRELQRAKSIIIKIKENRLSKYNLSTDTSLIPTKPYVLVPGQVETDKSLKASGNGYKNKDAVKIARERYPNHLIVYRPHPDITYNSVTKQDESLAKKYADITTTSGDIIDWIERASAVVTITSNSGFEAIIRGIPVYCLGYPYYYGYGLTTDEIELPYRTRKLSLKQLVAGTLILYPKYYDYDSDMHCRIEEVLLILKQQSRNTSTAKNHLTRTFYKLKYLLQ